MSGHANFSAIGSGNVPKLPPNPQVDVGGSQQVGGAGTVGTGTGVQEAQQPVQVDAKLESSKELVRQLDVLLARAAECATKAVDAKALKETVKDAKGLAKPGWFDE